MKFSREDVLDGVGRLFVFVLFAGILLASCAPELLFEV